MMVLAAAGVVACVAIAGAGFLLRHHLFLLCVTRAWPDEYDLRLRRRIVAARRSPRRPQTRRLSCRRCGWSSSPFSGERTPRWLVREAAQHGRAVHGDRGAVTTAFDAVIDGRAMPVKALLPGPPVPSRPHPASEVVMHGARRAGGDTEPDRPAPALSDLVDTMAALVATEHDAQSDPHELADRLVEIAIKLADGPEPTDGGADTDAAEAVGLPAASGRPPDTFGSALGDTLTLD